jgi:hypothetical protein
MLATAIFSIPSERCVDDERVPRLAYFVELRISVSFPINTSMQYG